MLVYKGIFLNMLSLLHEFQVKKGFWFLTTGVIFQFYNLALFISFIYLYFPNKLHLNFKLGIQSYCLVTDLNQTYQTSLDPGDTPVNYFVVPLEKNTVTMGSLRNKDFYFGLK